MKLYLLVVVGDIEPQIEGPYPNEEARVAAARAWRQENGDRDGLFRLDATREPIVDYFGGAELEVTGGPQ